MIYETAVIMSSDMGMKDLVGIGLIYPAQSETIILAGKARGREFDRQAKEEALRCASEGTTIEK